MATASAGSAYPGIEALTRAQTDLATASQGCQSAIRAISPPDGKGPPHVPGLAFLAGMMAVSLASLDFARDELAELRANLLEEFAEAARDA